MREQTLDPPRSDSREKPVDRTSNRFARSNLQKVTTDRPWNRMMRDRFSEVMFVVGERSCVAFLLNSAFSILNFLGSCWYAAYRPIGITHIWTRSQIITRPITGQLEQLHQIPSR
jgi:hypothetical protein